MLELSRGQQLALLQLDDIVANSNGALEILEQAVESKSEGYISVSYTHLTLPTNREV